MKYALLITFVVYGYTINAVPSAFSSQCGPLDFINITSSTILRDHDDCSIAWVLPPTFGLVNFSGFTPSANLNLCEEIKDIQATSRNITRKIARISDKIELLSLEYEKKEGQRIAALEQVIDIEDSFELKEIGAIEDAIYQIDKRIDKMLSDLADCSRNCLALKEGLLSRRQERFDLKSRLFDLRDKYYDLLREAMRAKSELRAATEAVDSVAFSLETITEKQIRLKSILFDWLKFYARLEGGYSHLDYDTQWTQNVIALNKQYGNIYEFKQVPTRNARIFANIVGSSDMDSYLSSMPAILDYVIGGEKFTPWGEHRTIERSALSSTISGSLRLSLIGACPIYYQDFLDSDDLIKNDNFKTAQNFSLSASYEYPAAFKYEISASYNLYKFYEMISSSNSNGGFFSTSDFTETVNKKINHDDFNIHWDFEGDSFSKEEKEEIRKSIKADLVARVLGALARPVFNETPKNSYSPESSRENGATVLANGLNDTCGFDIFCKGAYWVLNTMSASFGSSKAEEKFRNTHDRKATETWSASEATWRTAATDFIGKR